MRRRTLVKTALIGGGVALTGATAWLKLAPQPPVMGFADFAAVRSAIAAWLTNPPATPAGHWDAARTLEHAAQSIEMSLDGYPQLRAAWFRASVGPLAFAVFDKRGQMRHSLVEPIPGAAPLAAAELALAATRLEAAISRFEAHSGPLAPHFAYGELDHPAYTRAHLMHLANHWTVFVPA